MFINYADLEGIKKKIIGCKNNPKNLSTTKVSELTWLCFPMPTISSFGSIEHKHDVKRSRFHEKVLWILKRACNESN